VRRFFVRPEAVEADRVHFDVDETRHLARVLRLRPGAVLEATDGTGRSFAVRLEALGEGESWGRILWTDGSTRESPCAITLAQALLRGERMSWLVQKATELGVARIVPTATARVVPRPEASRSSRHARWSRLAREAVKQCGRTRVPIVEAPRALAQVLEEIRAHDAAWVFGESGGVGLSAAARNAASPRSILLLVGPEGGLAPDEVARAEASGALVVGLGPRTLRAESAGLVAVALCQYLFGDLGASRGETGPVRA
jgi:16S rRNA (uracil1498-N3)-methyltransferase